jgi:methionine-rich copper-binding protein CopC
MKRVVLGVLLVASLLACGTQGVTPQNNGNGNNGNGNSGGDTTAPTLTSSNPINGASSIAINSKFKLVFSEKMDTASVTVVADPNSDLGDPAWNAAGTELRFDPPANLETSSDYTLSIAGKDVAGNALAATSVQFTTAGDSNPPPPVDTTAPTIVSSSPDDGNTNVAINANILITFSEAMNPGSVGVSISPNVNLGAAAFKSGNNTVEFNPPSDLAGNTNYTVTVSGKDVAGNDLTGSSSFSFKTATIADTTAPGIVQNVVAEAGDSQIKFTWNANTEPDLKGYTIYYSNNASNLSNSVFVAKPGTSKTLTGLTNGEIYFYQLEAEDGAGNKSGRTITKNATPKDATAPRLLSSSPANGAVNVPASSKVVFNFSEAMNPDKSKPRRPCVPLAGRPDANCGVLDSAIWDNGGKRLTLTYAVNSIGTAIEPTYIFETAEDKAGNPLPLTQIKFSLADTRVPSITTATPADGVVGMPNTVVLQIVFSEPMDRVSVQTAFRAQLGLFGQKGNVSGTFFWSGDDKTVTLQPSTLLPFGEFVSWGLNAGAKSKAGNAVSGELKRVFRVIQEFTVEAPVYGNGHVLRECVNASTSFASLIRCDDTAYASPARETVVRIGTRASTYGSNSKGYYAFRLNVIPANATITAARLQIARVGVIGDPFGNLGSLLLERVNPSQVIEQPYTLGGDRGDYNLPGLACSTCPLVFRTAGVDQNVLAFVLADRAESRAGSQFRLRHSVDIPGTGVGTGVRTGNNYADYSKLPTLTITYRIP